LILILILTDSALPHHRPYKQHACTAEQSKLKGESRLPSEWFRNRNKSLNVKPGPRPLLVVGTVKVVHRSTGTRKFSAENFQGPRTPLSRELRSPQDDQNVRFDKGNVAVVIKSRSDAVSGKKRAKFLSPGESNPALSRDRGRCYRYTRRDAQLLSK
jgi:hypothetical protein